MTDKEIAKEAAKHASKYEKNHSGNWMTAFDSFVMGCRLILDKKPCKEKELIGKLNNGWAVRNKIK
jgi:hypothetical protein